MYRGESRRDFMIDNAKKLHKGEWPGIAEDKAKIRLDCKYKAPFIVQAVTPMNMDKEPNEIHENLNPTKIKQSYHTLLIHI